MSNIRFYVALCAFCMALIAGLYFTDRALGEVGENHSSAPAPAVEYQTIRLYNFTGYPMTVQIGSRDGWFESYRLESIGELEASAAQMLTQMFPIQGYLVVKVPRSAYTMALYQFRGGDWYFQGAVDLTGQEPDGWRLIFGTPPVDIPA